MSDEAGGPPEGADWGPALRRALGHFARWAQDDPIMVGFLVLIVIMGIVVIFTG